MDSARSEAFLLLIYEPNFVLGLWCGFIEKKNLRKKLRICCVPGTCSRVIDLSIRIFP